MARAKMFRVAIPIHYRYDTFWARFVAAIIDGFIVVIPAALLQTLVDMASVSWLSLSFTIFSDVAGWTYFILGHGLYGRTVGKKTQNLRVVDFKTEQPISMIQALWRESLFIILGVIALVVSALIDFVPITDDTTLSSLGFGVILLQAVFIIVQVVYCLNNPKRRALHDLIAGTVVVRDNVPLVFAANEPPAPSEG
ncbi:MAG: RDD family protein [Pyrinomonadaceae bacterium]